MKERSGRRRAAAFATVLAVAGSPVAAAATIAAIARYEEPSSTWKLFNEGAPVIDAVIDAVATSSASSEVGGCESTRGASSSTTHSVVSSRP